MSAVSAVGRPAETAWVHKITCDEFMRMVEAGVFGEDSHVELLDGEIIEMSPMSPQHAFVIERLTRLFNRLLGDSYSVSPQLPMIAGRFSLPEPDLAVSRGERSPTSHPTGGELYLAVEVSLSSVGIDRKKAATYAASQVPEYWLVDIERRRLEVHTEPRDGMYRLIRLVDEFGEIAPAFAPDAVISVGSFLPPKDKS